MRMLADTALTSLPLGIVLLVAMGTAAIGICLGLLIREKPKTIPYVPSPQPR